MQTAGSTIYHINGIVDYQNSYGDMLERANWKVYESVNLKECKIPLYVSKIQAGEALPADDFFDTEIDLNSYLVKYPDATFFTQVGNDSITALGIFRSDILIVDRKAPIRNGKLVMAFIEGKAVVRRMVYKDDRDLLYTEDKNEVPVEITSHGCILGVVTAAIKKFQ